MEHLGRVCNLTAFDLEEGGRPAGALETSSLEIIGLSKLRNCVFEWSLKTSPSKMEEMRMHWLREAFSEKNVI